MFLALKTDLPSFKDHFTDSKVNPFKFLKSKKVTRKKLDFELAFSELYLKLILIQNFQSLNYTGFRKILKKYDKVFSTKKGKEWMDKNIESSIFFTSNEVETLINDIEEIVTHEREGGDRSKAMKKLRVPPLGQDGSWATFTLGLFGGITLVITMELISSIICE